MVCHNKTGNTFTHNLLNAVRTRTNASLSPFMLKAKSMPSLARSISFQFCTEGLSSHSPSSVKSLSSIRGRFAKSKRKLIIFPQLCSAPVNPAQVLMFGNCSPAPAETWSSLQTPGMLIKDKFQDLTQRRRVVLT